MTLKQVIFDFEAFMDNLITKIEPTGHVTMNPQKYISQKQNQMDLINNKVGQIETILSELDFNVFLKEAKSTIDIHWIRFDSKISKIIVSDSTDNC